MFFEKKSFIVGLVLFASMLIATLTSTDSKAQDCTDALGNPTAICTSSEDAGYHTDGLARRAVDSIKNMIRVVEGQIDSVRTRSPFIPLGKKIIGVLAVLIITWSIMKGWILKPSATQIAGDLVFPFVIMGLAVASLDSNLGQLVADSVSGIAASMTTTGGARGTSAQIFAENMIKSMSVIWGAPNEFEITSLGLGTVMIGLLKLVAIFFIAGATAAGVATLLIAKFQVALAIALGPVMIPWAMWKPTEFLFSGWLSFLLKGSFMSIAVYTIESTLRATTISMADLASSVAPGVDSALTYGIIALMAMLFALLMLKASDMGSGLVSGGASGFAGFHGVTGGGAAAASKAVTGAATGTLKGSASLGASLAMGKSTGGKTDDKLSSLHKAARPPKGANRVAYELGRSAHKPDTHPPAPNRSMMM